MKLLPERNPLTWGGWAGTKKKRKCRSVPPSSAPRKSTNSHFAMFVANISVECRIRALAHQLSEMERMRARRPSHIRRTGDHASTRDSAQSGPLHEIKANVTFARRVVLPRENLRIDCQSRRGHLRLQLRLWLNSGLDTGHWEVRSRIQKSRTARGRQANTSCGL